MSETYEDMVTPDPNTHHNICSVVRTLSSMMSDRPQGRVLSNGDMALLRRATPEHPFTAVFWRLSIHTIEPRLGPMSMHQEKAWAVLLSCMATTDSLHDTSTWFGSALGNAGWSPERLERMLRADQDRLFVEMRQAARFLSSKGQRVDWSQGAQLLLYTEPGAEQIRRHIARSYYTAQYHNTQDTNA